MSFVALHTSTVDDPIFGRSDFVPTETVVTFRGPGQHSEDIAVPIALINDDIHEPREEAFVVMLELNETTCATAHLTRSIAVGVIVDDDGRSQSGLAPGNLFFTVLFQCMLCIRMLEPSLSFQYTHTLGS